jgi:ELWxxDGT repeat protein
MCNLLPSIKVQQGLRRRTSQRHPALPIGSLMAAALLLSLAIPIQAGSRAFLVKDIEPGSGGSSPYLLINAKDTLFFSAGDVTNNRRYLWKSDGTIAGTIVVSQLMPTSIFSINRTLFFTADDSIHGMELWKSDGTTAGTVLVKDIAVGVQPSYPAAFARLNDALVFIADDGLHGYEVWTSDGTAAGTILVADVHPGPDTSHPAHLTSINGALFFTADDGISGIELWKSDGTAAGTALVKDISPGLSDSNPVALADLDGTLMFFADDSVHGTELWSSDGTSANTVLVKDIQRGISNSFDKRFASYAPAIPVVGKLFFAADDGTHGYELWSSDGTSAGTTLVKDIFPDANSSYPATLTDLDGKLAFIANDGIHGYELWRSDGTGVGTNLVKDIRAGSGTAFGLIHVDPEDIWLTQGHLTSIRGMLFFAASDGLHGSEPWQSNGTEEYTRLVEDIAAGSISSLDIATPLVESGDLLFFGATDGHSGQELWAFHTDEVTIAHQMWLPLI